jgi:membrane protease YdiL (CAAX protease family)
MRLKLGISLLLLDLIVWLVSEIVTLSNAASPYIGYTYVATNYVIIAVLVWIERENLGDFHLDQTTLFIMGLSSIFRVRSRFPGEGYFLVVIGIAGLIILGALILNHSKVPKTNFRWAFIGALISFILIFPSAIIEAFQFPNVTYTPYPYPIMTVILAAIANDLAFTTLIEEMVFRGFLWGYLRRVGWEENRIIWVQGTLFWLLHFNYIGRIYIFLLTIPIITFALSKLTQKSRQIFPSILLHTTQNIIPQMLINLLAK